MEKTETTMLKEVGLGVVSCAFLGCLIWRIGVVDYIQRSPDQRSRRNRSVIGIGIENLIWARTVSGITPNLPHLTTICIWVCDTKQRKSCNCA